MLTRRQEPRGPNPSLLGKAPSPSTAPAAAGILSSLNPEISSENYFKILRWNMLEDCKTLFPNSV